MPKPMPYWLRYVTAPVDGGGGDDRGFPADTPVDQMSDSEKAAYWRAESKKQQKAREDAERLVSQYSTHGTPEELQQAKDAAEQARLAALNDSQREAETIRAAAKAEGLTEGRAAAAELYMAPAIKYSLVAHVRGTEESVEDATKRVEGALAFADLAKFLGDDGVLDADKIQTFAQSIGSAGPSNDTPPSSAGWGALHAQAHQYRSSHESGKSGSVSAMEQAAYEELTKK